MVLLVSSLMKLLRAKINKKRHTAERRTVCAHTQSHHTPHTAAGFKLTLSLTPCKVINTITPSSFQVHVRDVERLCVALPSGLTSRPRLRLHFPLGPRRQLRAAARGHLALLKAWHVVGRVRRPCLPCLVDLVTVQHAPAALTGPPRPVHPWRVAAATHAAGEHVDTECRSDEEQRSGRGKAGLADDAEAG